MKYGILLFSVFFFHSVFSQSPDVAGFTAVEQEGKVYVSWTVRQGSNTCSDLEIQRAVADSAFRTIYTVPGICGATGADEHYRFADDSPVGFQHHAYRLQFGGQGGYTDTVSLFFIPYAASGFVVDPELKFDGLRLYFDPSLNLSFSFELFDAGGRCWHRVSDFKGNEYELKAPAGAGIYLIRVYPEGLAPVTAKVLLQR